MSAGWPTSTGAKRRVCGRPPAPPGASSGRPGHGPRRRRGGQAPSESCGHLRPSGSRPGRRGSRRSARDRAARGGAAPGTCARRRAHGHPQRTVDRLDPEGLPPLLDVAGHRRRVRSSSCAKLTSRPSESRSPSSARRSPCGAARARCARRSAARTRPAVPHPPLLVALTGATPPGGCPDRGPPERSDDRPTRSRDGRPAHATQRGTSSG
jgi:hypothetical protein